MFNIDEYLAHIGFVHREGESAKDRLIRLHRCHSLAVPFEDFSSFCGLPVSLDIDDIFEKVIRCRRGGYCFELNLLFQRLLNSLGYETKAVLCRPFSGEGVKLPLTHRLTIVSLEGQQWAADVGLGGNGWVEPLLLQIGTEQVQFGRTYRIREESEMGYVVELLREGTFVPAVAFGLQYAEESDFEMSNYYTSSFPAAPFVTRMMCTLPTFEGRYTIRDKNFKIEKKGEVFESPLDSGTFPDVLGRYFGIILTPEMNSYIRDYLERG